MTEHGYVRYTRGCRCGVCTAAKATYVREKRAAARELRLSAPAGERYIVPGITHGYAGYQDAGCRCEVCCANRRDYDTESRWYKRRAAARHG